MSEHTSEMKVCTSIRYFEICRVVQKQKENCNTDPVWGVTRTGPKKGAHLKLEHFTRTTPRAKGGPRMWVVDKDHSRTKGGAQALTSAKVTRSHAGK